MVQIMCIFKYNRSIRVTYIVQKKKLPVDTDYRMGPQNPSDMYHIEVPVATDAAVGEDAVPKMNKFNVLCNNLKVRLHSKAPFVSIISSPYLTQSVQFSSHKSPHLPRHFNTMLTLLHIALAVQYTCNVFSPPLSYF
ncbi:uncharacterized protein EDB91DRAFT_1082942 [Suillus paluster]|uniref:uncharacterized protein n=1 Tax=Suillus paluster TaxID=48578 RepID=UPI001B86D220|nr:uncharacterized protein EDB91DRAFT_1082942 [Suillus paluster]KAG1737841.1 hypothetical protein EDB91DRAFT_1082942 [Suillus paluster]